MGNAAVKKSVGVITTDSKIETISILKVKEWKENPRKNDAAIPKLAEILKEKGQVTPIVVWRKNNVVYKGNTTLKALKSLGVEKVKVVYADFPSEQSAVAYGIADNKSGEWSEWDDKILGKLMKSGINIQSTGFMQSDSITFDEVFEIDNINKNIEPVIESKKESVKLESSKTYSDFINSKIKLISSVGFDVDEKKINDKLFDFQKAIVRWAVKRGCAAIFSGTGTGKTYMEIEWARIMADHSGKPVLILAPLAVSQQTVKIGSSIGTEIKYNRTGDVSGKCKIFITNYEHSDKFDPSKIGAIVLDESSIIKSYDSATMINLMEKFHTVKYKLCATATPAPNDYMEIGTHAEFLGVMRRVEMLAMFFVHDGGRTSQWRLKGHAKEDFWKWIASWAVMFQHPGDIGFTDKKYEKFFDLPKLIYKIIKVKTNATKTMESGIQSRISDRKKTIGDRVRVVADIISKQISKDDSCVVWCDLNDESDMLSSLILNSNQIQGSDPIEIKEERLNNFSSCKIKRLITKPSIAGFGLNWQHCHNMVFVGLSDSFEQYYQAIRRCWRAGQKYPVNVYIVIADIGENVLNNVQRKEYEFQTLQKELNDFIGPVVRGNIIKNESMKSVYKTAKNVTDNYALYMGDCVDVMKILPKDSIGYSIFSPPFASLYTYSDSARDFGNCTSMDQFFKQMKFFSQELLRIMMPGRNLSLHCMNMSSTKTMHGVIGLIDFRGKIISMMVEAGFVYHSEVTIWKNPATEMQRTKALGLLHRQLKKDSAMSRNGVADYVVTFRKPGVNTLRITNTDTTFPVDKWREYASPVWMDINQSDTLQRTSVREFKDERHICPLQLEVIRRCIRLWSLKNDTVLSPFMGIGSEGYIARLLKRKFVGIELKEAYYKQAHENIKIADADSVKVNEDQV
jgi:superfamily II DNA or RNA helicase